MRVKFVEDFPPGKHEFRQILNEDGDPVSRELAVPPRVGEVVHIHQEHRSAMQSKFVVVEVHHVYEEREWYQEKSRQGDTEMGDKVIVVLKMLKWKT